MLLEAGWWGVCRSPHTGLTYPSDAHKKFKGYILPAKAMFKVVKKMTSGREADGQWHHGRYRSIDQSHMYDVLYTALCYEP